MSTCIYVHKDTESAKGYAVDDPQVRLCRAKFFAGEIEHAKQVNQKATPFDRVCVMPDVPEDTAAAIFATYEAAGQKVERLQARGASSKPAGKARVTAKDLGWTLKSSPADYLKQYPKGASAGKAREVLKKLGA